MKLQNLIILGIYQLLFTDKIPAYAALNTTVELSKQIITLKKHTNFVNGILRTLQRETKKVPFTQESSRILPLNKDFAWEFSQSIFPDPTIELYDYWGTVYSYPTFLVEKWATQFGQEKCLELLKVGNLVPPIFIRPRINIKEIEDMFKQNNIPIMQYNNLLQFNQQGKIEHLPGFSQGKWTVIGPVAALIVETMGPKAGMNILDMCAAPGTKTFYIADLIHNEGRILACDIARRRLQLLNDTKHQFRLHSIQTLEIDSRGLPQRLYNGFDQVLIDAPCSNSGVLSKRVEARWRLTPQELANLQKNQMDLLEQGSKAVKKGGVLVYATCSLEKEENEEVIENFCKIHPEFKQIFYKKILPLAPVYDGGTFFGLLKSQS